MSAVGHGGGEAVEAWEPTPPADAVRWPRSARQTLLDALPIPAAVMQRERGVLRIAAHNARFGEIALHARADLAEALATTFGAADGAGCLAWSEPGAGGRHYRVHLTHLDNGGSAMLLSLVDRTAAIETERSLRFTMLHDSLTGLPNRLAFVDAIDKALGPATAAEQPAFAVIAIDLVRFSRVNESAGALAGDELIITVARRLVQVMRPGDVLARTSGDEFSLLVRMSEGPGDALHMARRIRTALEAPFRLSDVEITVDAAIGCALWHDRGATAEDLLRNAQFALKRAKKSCRIELYDVADARIARRRFGIETELRRAIERDALDLHFQPVIDLDDGSVKGFEALCRWDHPDRGVLAPSEFVAVAEESGLILPLGRWVIDRAVRTVAEWEAATGAPLPFRMGINVSPVQLKRDRVADALERALTTHGVRGERITIELTENSFIDDPDCSARLLEALKGMACKLAIDDFGTGYSSLAYLQKLPIDVLKIDRAFVTDMLGNRDATAIVRAILSLASALGMHTVAEGIETMPLARTLAALGCGAGQGFHFAAPMNAEEALAYFVRLRAGGAAACLDG